MKIKNKNFFLFFLIILFLHNCGFSPMYKNINDLDFSILIAEVIGNKKINDKIKSKLNSYKTDNANKTYEINIISKYNKNILTKDLTGAATEYKIIIETKFYVKSENFEKELNYTESFNMQSFNDKLEEQDYEDSIQESLTNIISRKLILQLSQIK